MDVESRGKYLGLVQRYSVAFDRNSRKPFSFLRPRVQRDIKTALKGLKRCYEVAFSYPEGDHVESFLNRLYSGDLNDRMNGFNLSEVGSIGEGCFYILTQIGNKTLRREEYRDVSSIIRRFRREDDIHVLTEIGDFQQERGMFSGIIS